MPEFEGDMSGEELGSEPERERRERVAKILELVENISESGEGVLPFPGMDPDAYSKMKATGEEFSGYTTPIDEIIERCNKEGIRVVLGKNPESGNVYVLPAGSTNIEMDSIAPHQLAISGVTNRHLAELIQLTGSNS